MPERDIISWNTCIRVFSDNGQFLKSLVFFKYMLLTHGLLPNVISIVSILPVCSVLHDEMLVGSIHCYVFKAGLDGEIKVCNGLIDAYGKSGNVDAMEGVFDEMINKNEVTWNSVIGAFSYIGYSSKALDYFSGMINWNVKLNTITIATILPTLVEFHSGKELHAFCVRRSMNTDIFVANALIDLYGKWGHSFEASYLFNTLPSKNIVSWNTMIGNNAQNGLEFDAAELLRQMQDHGEYPNSVTLTNALSAFGRLGSLLHGKEIHGRSVRSRSSSDTFVSNALTDMYAKCNRLDLALKVFDLSRRDEVSYNILIMAYSQTLECSNSISLFTEMHNLGMTHDTVSYTGVLSACSNMYAVNEGKQIHGFAVRKLFHGQLFIANSLMYFYCKCGQIHSARKIFDRMKTRDVASWNTLILGYGMIGEVYTVIGLFESMKYDGVEYDRISYIAVLSACSHAGLVEKGKMYFADMVARNIEPSDMHYACMVDLFGRFGLMNEAVELIKGLSTEPGADTWGALLGASRIHGNVEVGCWAAKRALELKPDHPGYYVLLSNMYSEVGRSDEADRIRNVMKMRRVKKNPGCSWIQNEDGVHAFVNGERFDPSFSHAVSF